MPFFRGLTSKNLFSSASAVRRKKEKDWYLKNGSAVLEELLTLCDGNCRIPIRYFTATEIHNAMKHKTKMDLADMSMVTGLLGNRPLLVRPSSYKLFNFHRDIAVTAQMSHLKNVLRLVGCCLEFEDPFMVYEHVEGISLSSLLYKKFNRHDQTRKSLSWGNRLRVAREVASAIVFLHTEFTTPIIHRNITPHNVIIDEKSGVAKILNFSLSISLPPGELEVQDEWVCGTLGYIAPEYEHQLIITQKTDVYSFGILLFQLLTGKDLYDIRAEVDLYHLRTNNSVDYYIKKDNVMDIADPIILEEHGIEIQQQLEDYLDLVKKCTALKGDDRPYMIHVARELCRIERCYRALTLALGQN